MSADRLEELRMQAQHARQRYDLYKAKAYGPRPTSAARMRELERGCARAEASLRFAEAEANALPPKRTTEDTGPDGQH